MKINGNMLRDMIVSGANNVDLAKNLINDLNVFPVPDGDTGTNMSLTLKNGLSDFAKLEGKNVSEISKVAASNYLKGARGNSGVILSLLFRGISKELEGADEIDGVDLARAFTGGVKAAYKAVMKPTEGTILTVARVSAEEATEFAKTNSDPVAVLDKIIETAELTLEKTPDLLPVLKQAGVVDSGGKGYVMLVIGMQSMLKDGKMIEASADGEAVSTMNSKADFKAMSLDDIEFAYCTEFIINKHDRLKRKDPAILLSYLEKIGDSLVFVDDEDLIKVHVHTNSPGRVLQEALKQGHLEKIKIENMVEQLASHQQEAQSEERVIAAAEKKYGFVAISPGDGITEVLSDFLVDNIIEGGQTMNPSTEDILAAIDKTPSEVVFVLPNNKNVILSAQMAVGLSDKKVFVVPSRTVPEGFGALMAFDESLEDEALFETMSAAMKNIKSGAVTYAVRDSEVQGKKVKKNEFMAFNQNELAAVEKTSSKAFMKLIGAMINERSEFMTVFYGSDISEAEAQKLEANVKKKYGESCDIIFTNGAQPVYSFIISVE